MNTRFSFLLAGAVTAFILPACQAAPTAKPRPMVRPVAKAQAAKPAAPTKSPTVIAYNGPDSAAVSDLKAALQGFNAGTITLEKVDLGNRTGQEFYLERKAEKTLIRYSTNAGLENAVYTLLGQWGFHWYGPGENWFVKPATVSGADIPGRWIAPTFRNRNFFGTGGLDFGAKRVWDPDNSYKTGWYTWKRRNRFNADFGGTGHAGQAFYLENKALLDANPGWFNSEAGKAGGRMKIEIPAAMDAYKAWIKKKYSGSKEPFITVGVDPEDGRGGPDDPLPPDGFAGIAKWNHADKWWWVANEVAKEFPEDGRHIVVSMYAYGDGATNALTPKFQLRKNVYPVIVPYAFQTAYLPNEMVKEWAKKIDGTQALYDYWNITQWSLGLPQFDIYSIKPKLQFWKNNKVDGLYMETTDAAGPMGHGWWLGGQMQFDLNQDFEKAYNQYLTDLFGPAAPAMKKMYDRWSRAPQGAGEVNLSLADLQAAEALVQRGGPQWKRINELKAYVHYMKLYYAHDGTQASKDRLFHYLYSIHHLYMVQTAAFLGQWYIPPFDKGNITPAGEAKRLTEDEIDAQFKADLLSDPKKYDVLDFSFDFKKVSYLEPVPERAWRFGRSSTAYFEPQSNGTVAFDAGSESDSAMTLFTDDGILIKTTVGKSNSDYTETIDGRTWSMKRFTQKVTAGKRYYVRLRGAFNRFAMKSELVPFTQRNGDDFDNYAYPPHYFYVPKGCTEIIFSDAHGKDGATGVFYLPGETPGPANNGQSIGIKEVFRVPVKPEWQGQVIACNFGHTSWGLKNLPNVFSLGKFKYNE